MIDKEFGKKWIEALRSGKYKQGQGMLCCEGSTGEQQFCCLGVACVVAELPMLRRDGNVYFGVDEERYYSPTELSRFGISERGGLYSQSFFLSELNDAGKSFEEIAKYIEEEIQCPA